MKELTCHNKYLSYIITINMYANRDYKRRVNRTRNNSTQGTSQFKIRDNRTNTACLSLKSLQSNDTGGFSGNTIQRLRTIAIETEFDPNNQHVVDYANRINVHKYLKKDEHSSLRGDVAASDMALNPIEIENNSHDHAPIAVNETVVIVSHGELPNIDENQQFFASMNATAMALYLRNILPPGYTGQIYLDGCYTGQPVAALNDGTSYAERVKRYLIGMGFTGFTIKGNLGEIRIDGIGKGHVKVDNSNIGFLNQRILETYGPTLALHPGNIGWNLAGKCGRITY
ncbi:MAG: hypothetical protein K5874_00785 [Bacteroidaceae bacterium]|nr:hypothetical protein [Bacteroidaceae bacterium]